MMKAVLHRIVIATLALAASSAWAFDWPGGTLSVSVTARGSEVFAGRVPSSPWGSTNFLNDPVVELRGAGNVLVAQRTITGTAADWFDGGERNATVTFDVPAGSYTLVGRDGTRHVRFAGEGWSGFRLAFDPIAEPATEPPPPVQFMLMTFAGPGGSVSPGGTFVAGTVASVAPFPDASHDFAGWSGDAGGGAVPLAVLMDRDKAVTANFALKSFTLVTSALGGGSVTPGGTYPIGSTVTLSAVPDAWHYFAGWTGDASGSLAVTPVFLDRPKMVTAQFAPKADQSITFPPPGDQPVGSTLSLTAASSSGLPVSLAVVSGPAVWDGSTLTVNGPGQIVVRATQPGDAYTLPAPAATVTFNGLTAVASITYQPAARTLLQQGRAGEGVIYVLERP